MPWHAVSEIEPRLPCAPLRRAFRASGRIAARAYSGLRDFLPAFATIAACGAHQVPIHPGERRRIGSLEVRLARSATADVRRAQRLRYNVFYTEMSAVAAAPVKLARRDIPTRSTPYATICW